MHQTLSGMTKDGVVVSVEVAFQYKVTENKLMPLTMDYKTFDFYQSILKLKSRSGIRNACMKYMAQEFQTQRAAVQVTLDVGLPSLCFCSYLPIYRCRWKRM